MFAASHLQKGQLSDGGGADRGDRLADGVAVFPWGAVFLGLTGDGQGCPKVSSAQFFREHHTSKGKHEPNVVSDFLQTGVDGAEAVESQHVHPDRPQHR